MKNLLILALLSTIVVCVYVPNQQFASISASIGPNQIYSATAANGGIFSLLSGLENPLSVEISFNGSITSTTTLCLNSAQGTYPVAGNNLENNCPSGGLVSSLQPNATTTGSSKLKFTRKNTSQAQFLSKMVEDASIAGNAQPVYGTPSSSAGFVFYVNDLTETVQFTLTLTGGYCNGTDEIAVNGTCVPTNSLAVPSDTPLTLKTGWNYYYFTAPLFDSTVSNEIAILSNYSFYVQAGVAPTDTFNLFSGTANVAQNIVTPASSLSTQVYYIGFLNSGAADVAASLNLNYTVCQQGLIGPACAVNSTVSTSNQDGSNVIGISANLSSTTGNEGDAISIDLSGSDNTYAYFAVTNLPDFSIYGIENQYPYYVRVSAGNNQKGENGPTIYAKLGGYPSSTSYDLQTANSVANQVILQVNNITIDQWFVAVQLPSDFSIWIGVNCPGECDNNAHGSCQCSLNGEQVACSTIGNSTNGYYGFYSTLPSSTLESSGSCTCTDSDYSVSFDCSQKDSPTLLFIVLIVIGGLIILFVAIGVPLYCYISNKRKERYERI